MRHNSAFSPLFYWIRNIRIKLKDSNIIAALIGAVVSLILGAYGGDKYAQEDFIASLNDVLATANIEQADTIDKQFQNILDMSNEKKEIEKQNKLLLNDNDNLKKENDNLLKEVDEEIKNQEHYEKSREYLANDDIRWAITELRFITDNYSNTNQVKRDLSNLAQNYRNNIIKQADEYINNNNFDKAIKICKEADVFLYGDIAIKEKIKSCYELYEIFLIEKATNEIAIGDYKSAKSTISSAMGENSKNNKLLEEMLTQVEDLEKQQEVEIPVSLFAMTEFYNNTKAEKIYKAKDTYQEFDGPSYNIRGYKSNEKRLGNYVEFNLGKFYKTFTGTVAWNDNNDTNPKNYAYVIITTDNGQGVTSEKIYRKSQACNFNMSVEDAQFLQIRVVSDSSSSLILNNLNLYRKN